MRKATEPHRLIAIDVSRQHLVAVDASHERYIVVINNSILTLFFGETFAASSWSGLCAFWPERSSSRRLRVPAPSLLGILRHSPRTARTRSQNSGLSLRFNYYAPRRGKCASQSGCSTATRQRHNPVGCQRVVGQLFLGPRGDWITWRSLETRCSPHLHPFLVAVEPRRASPGFVKRAVKAAFAELLALRDHIGFVDCHDRRDEPGCYAVGRERIIWGWFVSRIEVRARKRIGSARFSSVSSMTLPGPIHGKWCMAPHA